MSFNREWVEGSMYSHVWEISTHLVCQGCPEERTESNAFVHNPAALLIQDNK